MSWPGWPVATRSGQMILAAYEQEYYNSTE